MGANFVWPYYYPQQNPYFQFLPTATDPGFGHRPSRSWHGSPASSPPVLPTFLPVIQAAPPVPSPVYQPTLLHPGYARDRRHSDAALFPMQQTVAPAVALWPPAVPAPYFTYPSSWTMAPVELLRPQLHNLINGEIVAHHLYTNLAEPDLVFRKRTRGLFAHTTTLSAYELEQPATDPQMTRVRVICDVIPQWPIDLRVVGTSLEPHRRGRAALPYLTIEDVIHAVHAVLHRRVSHAEWGRLTTSQATDIARAYTHRYKASGSEWSEQEQKEEGVKRVDFLQKHSWFRGFTWLTPEGGVERLKLLIGQSPD